MQGDETRNIHHAGHLLAGEFQMRPWVGDGNGQKQCSNAQTTKKYANLGARISDNLYSSVSNCTFQKLHVDMQSRRLGLSLFVLINAGFTT
ncbi:hypothetical protein J3459_013611 [Metarhizium acridum]|nr:hypothetical protein J3459_013611 [Metarhizium acridum]